VFLADADLSDLSIDLRERFPVPLWEPWVVVNEWLPGPSEAGTTEENPSGLVDALKTHIAGGATICILLGAEG